MPSSLSFATAVKNAADWSGGIGSRSKLILTSCRIGQLSLKSSTNSCGKWKKTRNYGRWSTSVSIHRKCTLVCLESIWHEHSLLLVKRLLLKNSKLKIWQNSDKTTRRYTTVWICQFSAQNLVLFAARPKPGHVSKNAFRDVILLVLLLGFSTILIFWKCLLYIIMQQHFKTFLLSCMT